MIKDGIHEKFKKKNTLVDGVLYRECTRCLNKKEIRHFAVIKTRKNAPLGTVVQGAPIVIFKKTFSKYCLDCEAKKNAK